MSSISLQLKKIEDDIVLVLTESGEAMTQHQLFAKSKLQNMSYFGWPFALDKLEKKGKITYSTKDRSYTKLYWSLVKK